MPIIVPGTGYTLTEYRASLASKGYNHLDEATLDPAINEARRRVFRERRWGWMQAISTPAVVTIGSPEVSLTAIPDLLWLDAVRLEGTSGLLNLSYLPPQEFRDIETLDPGRTGVPTYWTVAGSSVRLTPWPSLAYALTIDFSTMPDDLVADDDVDDMPRIYGDLVVWAAIVHLAFRQREAWAMQYAEDQYQTLLRAARAQDQTEQRQTSQQVKRYWSS